MPVNAEYWEHDNEGGKWDDSEKVIMSVMIWDVGETGEEMKPVPAMWWYCGSLPRCAGHPLLLLQSLTFA